MRSKHCNDCTKFEQNKEEYRKRQNKSGVQIEEIRKVTLVEELKAPQFVL